MDKTFLFSQLEAVLFAAGDPLFTAKLAQALNLSEQELEPLLEEYGTVWKRRSGDSG